MLWQKAWIETRWRFVIGMGILVCSGVGTVMLYPRVQELMGTLPANVHAPGVVGDKIREALALAHTLRGYVWSNWFGQNMPQQWSLMAAIIGTGGLASQERGGGALFTLALPVSRERHLMTRTAMGLAQIAALALVPAFAVGLAAPAVGGGFPIPEALFYGLSMFLGGTVVFSLAVWLSTVFTDLWRPALLATAAAFLLALPHQLSRDPTEFDLFRIMSGASWFEGGQPPWLGWLASLGASALLIYAAARTLARRDF